MINNKKHTPLIFAPQSRMKFKLLSILFLLICYACGNPSKAKNLDTNKSLNAVIDTLVGQASRFHENGNYIESQQLFNKANSLLTPKTDTSTRLRLLFNHTELLKHQGKYEECIQHYYKASELAQLQGDTIRIGLAYYNISTTYYLLKNIEEAKKYNIMAQNIYRTTTEKKRLMNCYVLYSSICRLQNDRSQAKKYIEKAIHFYEEEGEGEERNLAICINNYGNLLFEENKYPEAIAYYLKAVEVSQKLNDQHGLAIKLGNIGEIYLIQNQLENAKIYIDSSLSIANKLGSKETILTNLERHVSYYKKKNDYEKALEVSQELIALKTELLQLESSNLIEKVEEKFKKELKFTEANNKIALLKKDNLVSDKNLEQARLKLYFLVILSLLIIYVSYVIYKKQKNIRSKDKELHSKEREILMAENNVAEIKKEQLEKELEFKRKELLTFSMSLSEREVFLEKLKKFYLRIAPNKIPQQEVLEELKNLLYTFDGYRSTEIHSQIEKINGSFHFKLESNYPKLTEDDIRLASLLVLGLTSKEIANMLYIEVKSVNMKRYRLKKKLNLDHELDLKVFLMNV